MPGGLLQLVSKGVNDIYLTQDPNITLFKCVYRRHSNFCKVEKRLNFPNKLTFERTGHCRLRRLADLVHKMYLVIELPEVMVKYQFLTVKKINDILNLVGINFPFEPEYTEESRILRDFYIKEIVPYIETKINQYINMIDIAREEIDIIKSFKKTYDAEGINISKYLYQSGASQNKMTTSTINNVCPSDIESDYPTIPIKYIIYSKILQIKTEIDPSMNPLFNVFGFLINMYNKIDGKKIKLYNATTVKNVICDVALSTLFEKGSGAISLTPGYNGYDGYIIKKSDGDINVVQHNYISDNYLFLKSIDINDDNIIFIQAYSDYDLSSFFENLIGSSGIGNSILQNLDLYLIYRKYLGDINKKNPTITSRDNLITVKNNLVNILSQSLLNNLGQFLTILNVARNFRMDFRNNNYSISTKIFKSILMYGFFYPTGDNVGKIIIENNSDRDIFFYDSDYSRQKYGDYYCNIIKVHVNKFFSNLSDIVKGTIPDQVLNGNDLKFIPYYNDINYWSYLTLVESVPNPMNLSGILYGQYKFSNIGSISNVWLMELVPLVVMQNLYSIFQNNQIKGNFWGANFKSSFQINESNRDKYIKLLLNPYKVNSSGTYQLDTVIYNYLTSRIKNINIDGHILSHVFCPYTIYYKGDVLKELGIDYENGNLHYLQYIYKLIDFQNPNQNKNTIPGVPDLLLPLDVLLLTIGYDILLAIDASSINSIKIVTDIKYAAMKILHLYVMSYEELPSHSTPLIDPIYYISSSEIYTYVDYDLMNISNGTYNNNIARISTIWNYITRNQIISYNDLFANKLLSTHYYRLKTVHTNYDSEQGIINQIVMQGGAPSLGIGYTMQQAYEIFVSYFFNKRLNVTSIQEIPLELILSGTNFYGISYIDPINTIDLTISGDFIGKLQDYIYSNIISKIIQVNSNVGKYIDILEVRSINIDSSRYYYNTIFNIMGGGVDKVNFKFDGEISDESKLLVNSIQGSFKVDQPYGYLGQILINDKISKLPSYFVQSFIGECYKALKIVPLPFGVKIKSGSMYTSMYDPLPYKKINNISTNQDELIVRGVLDLLANFRLLIQSNDSYGEDELNLYDSILAINSSGDSKNIYPNIHIARTWNDLPLNQHITVQDDIHNYDPDMNILQFMSSNNNPGNLFTSNNNNPLGFNNGDIATKYMGFENVYSIIQYLLDLIINILVANGIIFDLGSLTNQNEEAISNTYIKYLEQLIEKYNKYLSLLTYQGGSTLTYNNSYIFNRISRLLWNGSIHKAAEFAWAKYIGYDLISELSIKIGGQLIDKHDYKWMYLDYLINKNKSKVRGHGIMVGNVPELYDYSDKPKPNHVLYVPIQLWFCKNINQSLPLLCMRYTDVDITVKIRGLNEVAWWEQDDTFFIREPSLNCYLLADYIYLDMDERKSFVTSKHEYLIESVQHSSVLVSNNLLDGNNFNINIILTNICKFLIWTLKFNDHRENSDNDMYSVLNWIDFEYKSDRNPVEDFDIKFNQRERETVKKASYYNLVQPYEKGVSSLTKNIYLYSFALFPRLLQPSGGVNVDMLDELSINMRLSERTVSNINAGNVKFKWDVFGKEINILRIMSGMSGLVFF